VARNIFHHGWRGVWAPRASFSLPGYEEQPFTSIQLEFPFHGLLGWPIAELTHHERTAVRIVSLFFALISIRLVYGILVHWFRPLVGAAGAAIWAAAPLVVQFGRAPMPDIVCTAGMLAAFLLALRGNLAGSSGCFLFSILAKTSVIVFGLPILVALLIREDSLTFRRMFRVALWWGIAPLVGLVTWVSLMHWFAPPTPWTLLHFVSDGPQMLGVTSARFWIQIAACLLPFGAGLLGLLGIAAAWGKASAGSELGPLLKWTIFASNVFYLILVLRKISEPQYFLPPLAWLVIAAAPGLGHLAGKLRSGMIWRYVLPAIVGMHIVLAIVLARDLRSSRVPDFPSIESAARLLPPEARVVVAYPFYGASAAVWLNRNVYAVHDIGTLTMELPRLREAGFTHLCLLDIESRHNLSAERPMTLTTRQLQKLLGRSRISPIEDAAYASAGSSIRQYCDQRFPLLFASPHALLYSIPSSRLSQDSSKDGG
jgi:hypothetical protein